MAKRMPSAAEVADRWKTGFSAAGPAWEAGINAVERAPGIDAAAARDRYLAGVTQNVDKFAANVAAIPLPDWKSTSITKGKTRLASGAAAGQQKFQNKMGPVLVAIGQIRDSLPPRGDINTNLARLETLARGLHERAQRGW